MTIQEKLTIDQLIDELKGHHYDFRQRLFVRFPHLTEYDLRLCILIKGNLSTKEIATLLNITPDSVKKAKHRLRKKLAVSPHTGWSLFFRTI